MRARRWACALFALAVASARAAPLPAYDVDPDGISVSGVSSGGFMAVQMHVAFSATFRKGVGVVAGGAYDCAQDREGQALLKCMDARFSGVPRLATLVAQTRRRAAAGAIDATSNLAGSRVWLFTGGRFDTGTHDTTVDWRVVDEARSYYRTYVPAANIAYKNDLRAEHAMPTDDYGRACDSAGPPYIANCRFDAAGAMLQWIYGPLAPRSDRAPAENLVAFDQSEFVADPESHGMWPTGYVYVPARCAAGARCRLHVAFHGCKQYPGYVYYDASLGEVVAMGKRFALEAGYNRWAEANGIIVLYPQANALYFGLRGKSNPNGCWDWWGYDDDDYAVKRGRQMAAVKAMVDRISGRP
ncbi:MAG TPA: hypothetical protein VFP36_15840 [Usitatibacter sp.]|nr:hypothetical protein [Usitatibacter sp.]